MLFNALFAVALAAIPAFAAPTPEDAASTATVTPVFCTFATYSPGDPYPYGVPSGTGTCFVPTVKVGKCYNWADFPRADAGPMIHNVSFTHIGNLFECNLYQTHHCKGPFFTAQAGDEDYNNSLTADISYNNKIDSFKCSSS